MSDLERALRELDVDWPATPDLATSVGARLVDGAAAHAVRHSAAGDRRRPADGARSRVRRRIAAVAAALCVIVGGTLAASPDARSTVLRWLGLKSVEIKRGTPRPGAGLELGRPIALPGGARVPAVLGTPDAVYDTVLDGGTHATSLLYSGPPRILVQTFRARVTPFIEKTVAGATTVERIGARGYWIAGAHGFAYQSPQGFGYEPQRLADRTLLIERADGLLIRIEGAIAKRRALAIAGSIPSMY